MKRLVNRTRLLLWGGGACLLFAACGNDYLFIGLAEPTPPAGVDVLLVIDDSPSMVDEQIKLAESLDEFIWALQDEYQQSDFRLAVTTGSVKSPKCPLGQGGKLSDRLGGVFGPDQLAGDFVIDARCRVVTRDNLDCLYHPGTRRGTLLAGDQGCGFRRGLSAMRRALFEEADFLRPEASLVVILISDGQDCGEPDELDPDAAAQGPLACYQAAGLTRVQEYHDFLMDQKGWQEGMVKFAVLTGMRDSGDPMSTQIEFEGGQVQDACVTPGCHGPHCQAGPGTRAIQLADMFGLGRNGMAESICRRNFTEAAWQLGEFSACPTVFWVANPLLNPGQAEIQINDQPIPRYSCGRTGELQKCRHPGDDSCAPDECTRTWIYRESAGTITFADHYNPCQHFSGALRLQVIDPVP